MRRIENNWSTLPDRYILLINSLIENYCQDIKHCYLTMGQLILKVGVNKLWLGAASFETELLFLKTDE
jgi:hypothetical protein